MKKAAAAAAAVLIIFLFSSCFLFVPFYSLTLIVDGGTGGTITCDPERTGYYSDTTVELTAIPDEGWVFKSWIGVAAEDGSSAAVLMDTNRTVTAVFEAELKRGNPTDNLIDPPSVGFSPSAEDTWTFMIYLDADNSLDAYSVLDLNEMEEGLELSGNGNINIIVLYDRWSDGSDWSDTRMYRIVPDATADIVSDTSGRLYPDSGAVAMTEGAETELNMGDPAVLADFLLYCRQNYAADHYALVLWNHGGGARNTGADSPELETAAASRLICEDDNTGDASESDYLFTDELQQALAAAADDADFPVRVDLIGADACIMGSIESAYELKDLTDCYVASMANESAYGWSYDDLFGRMIPDTGTSGAEALAALIVDSYKDCTASLSTQTLSAVRTSELSALKTAVDALYSADRQLVVESIRDSVVDFFDDSYTLEAIVQPYHDLNDFCYYIINNRAVISDSAAAAAEDVLDALSLAVISAYAGSDLGNYYGSGASVKRGLSILFSKGNLSYQGASYYAYQYWYTDSDCSYYGLYGYIDFCTSDENGIVESWREMQEAWYDPYRPNGYTPGCW